MVKSTYLVTILLVLLSIISTSYSIGSYVATIPDNSTLVFFNYPEPNCQGTPVKQGYIENFCQVEDLVGSWWSSFNTTHTWFENYLGYFCGVGAGDIPILTRIYPLNNCENCATEDCKS